ncbi:flagellin N-terminal helical domain-containing protein [Butyrivibrio sp. AE2015]|uniref:flagellin N-terminal helical domain-containing protein n=1 Tax=Butyrivibrio sp. AE2015 TaxID=1280663 RepID=UPI0003B607F6|nr:flagellin [Butyrivibrio sp. AE2015]
MRITNKIMQNNSLYNINNNKITENQLNTMMSTGKKITRPSDDPVIAIRALRLRSSVTQLSQYYEKNAKDAESWLDVTADALSTVTAVLTDCVKQATKGANMDLTMDDLSTIVTQMEALSKEYYSTGNVDFAGRYIFTGYRTDNALSFDRTTTADYTDINDEYNAENIGTSTRVTGMSKLSSENILNDSSETVYQSDIVEVTVGRLRLSYDTLNYKKNDGNTAQLKWRESLLQPATSAVDDTAKIVQLTFTTSEGFTHYASIPMNEDTAEDESFSVTNEGITYNITKNPDDTYTITGKTDTEEYVFKMDENGVYDSTGQSTNVASGITNIESVQKTTVTYTNAAGQQIQYTIPLLPAIGQTYTMDLEYNGNTAVATVNSDGTYTIVDNVVTENNDGTTSRNIVNVTGNGSIHSSYVETTLNIGAENIIYTTSDDAEIDDFYNKINEQSTGSVAYLNAATGEILLNEELTNKLSTLPDLINANSIDVVYDKKEWSTGDIKPENLFNCTYTDEDGTILYNHGTAAHDIAYDVGFAQSVVVNTTADAVFTTSVKRDVDDLDNMINELKQMSGTLKALNEKLEVTTDETVKEKLKIEIEAAQKAYDSQRTTLQKEFEHKITSMQRALDTANLAVTENGTRSKRLDLVSTRLMSQTTTFKTLQSDNEDIDIAETVTQLTSAQVTYEASLMATGKISQSSLINYI